MFDLGQVSSAQSSVWRVRGRDRAELKNLIDWDKDVVPPLTRRTSRERDEAITFQESTF